MNYTTETPVDAEWPFSQQPLHLGNIENHPILLTVAGYPDLDAIAEFAADSYITIKQASRFKPMEYFAEQRPLIRERYRSSLQAIMESCIPNAMAGVILKVEHRGVIKGMMALNLAQTDCGDPWTRHESLQLRSPQYARVFPTTEHLRLLYLTMADRRNGSRPILNVPHIISSMDSSYMATCLTTFMNILVRIAHTFDPELQPRIPSSDHWFYKLECPQFIGLQQLYLDRAIREAFEHFDRPLRPPQRTRDELSPVPSLVSDSGSAGFESSVSTPYLE
ncbi:hypothetical protein FHL15_009728 [Xylaria flabelliformis]|uniref:Uncharacterized protein n=1 Tax=Xylaria flabelliformis TaxID=2512241 RepID=A0A553HN98_9PEZI|nr:hypothetical protein FHL15_009728 [Xylaria flabelliformis]